MGRRRKDPNKHTPFYKFEEVLDKHPDTFKSLIDLRNNNPTAFRLLIEIIGNDKKKAITIGKLLKNNPEKLDEILTIHATKKLSAMLGRQNIKIDQMQERINTLSSFIKEIGDNPQKFDNVDRELFIEFLKVNKETAEHYATFRSNAKKIRKEDVTTIPEAEKRVKVVESLCHNYDIQLAKLENLKGQIEKQLK